MLAEWQPVDKEKPEAIPKRFFGPSRRSGWTARRSRNVFHRINILLLEVQSLVTMLQEFRR